MQEQTDERFPYFSFPLRMPSVVRIGWRAAVYTIAFIVLATSCGGSKSSTLSTETPQIAPASASPMPTRVLTATPAPLPTAPQPTPTPLHPADPLQPIGYPVDPATRTDVVVGAPGARVIAAQQGATVQVTSEQLQTSADAVLANQDGWDCRVHVEYEGQPAVDWYVQPGTPVYSTMDGDATLILNTVTNAFDYYGVSREPYIGNPDRNRAPITPFPGPGGGMGLYLSVVNDEFRIDLGHLSTDGTIANVPANAFAGGYSPSFDYRASFSVPRAISFGALVASWPVHRGDIVGYTGDSGYSEAAHLHYAITRRSDGQRLCATNESGFEDAAWLTR